MPCKTPGAQRTASKRWEPNGSRQYLEAQSNSCTNPHAALGHGCPPPRAHLGERAPSHVMRSFLFRWVPISVRGASAPRAAKPGAHLENAGLLRLCLLALAARLPATIQCIHRLPPVARAHGESVGIGFDLVAGDIAIADGRTNRRRLITSCWRLVAVHTRCLVAVDTRVIERSAAPNATLSPTDTARDLLDPSGGDIRRYELFGGAPNRTGLCLCRHRRQSANNGRARDPSFFCHDDLLCCRGI